ncbi:MAG: hypothetical protein M3065_19375 [Actinomycetota bacterium]|nr:hypothetical protein [Actinomycetota bacterium]
MKLHRSAVQRRRAFCASFAVIAVGLGTMGAVAYACTGGGGERTALSATSGTHGKSLAETTSTYGGALASGTYFFRYAPPGSSTACHHSAGIGGGLSPTVRGDIPAVSRTIPNLGSVAGTGEACWSVTNTHNNSQIAADKAIIVN